MSADLSQSPDAKPPGSDGLDPQSDPRSSSAISPATSRRRRRVAVALIGVALAATALFVGWRPLAAWLLLRQIQAALAQPDLLKASSLLDRYVADRPQDAQAWFLAARTSRRLGKIAQAEKLLEQCQLAGGVTEATLLEWDLLKVQQGKLAGVETRLRNTIGPEHPDAAFVLEAMARGFLKLQRVDDALEACHRWHKVRPEDPLALIWRAAIHERLQNGDKALADAERAVQIAPNFIDARLALGNVLLRMNRPADAAVHFEHVLEHSPGHIEAEIGLADSRILQGQAKNAAAALDRVLTIQPESSEALRLRGKVAFEVGQYADAEPYLRRAVQLAADDAEALQLLVACLRSMKRNEEAEKMQPQLQQLWKDLRRFDELVKEIARQPNNARQRLEAGLLALRLGRAEAGVTWLESTLQEPGDHRTTHEALAGYYEKQGNVARAQRHRQAAQEPRTSAP